MENLCEKLLKCPICGNRLVVTQGQTSMILDCFEEIHTNAPYHKLSITVLAEDCEEILKILEYKNNGYD